MSPDWATIGGNLYGMGLNLAAIRHLTGLPQGKRGHRLTSIRFMFKEESILIILKKDTPKGKMVAFADAETLEGAIWVMAQLIKSKSLKWRTDKWTSPSS